jgi:hypothetical protein
MREAETQPQAVFAFIHNRLFGTDDFHPYQKDGWRA